VERKIISTEDGSHTIAVPQLRAMYHSVHGAIQESKHVFIDAGLNFIRNNSCPQGLKIFEMGLGTGLNAFLTAIEAAKHKTTIQYTSIEPFPLSVEEVSLLNYPQYLQNQELFLKIHEVDSSEEIMISQFFSLRKENEDFVNYEPLEKVHLIYYDAFAPNSQPELWTNEIFEKLFNMLHPNGTLVTYCSKGAVRRAMAAAGFSVQKLQGPPGKREILRAIKSG